MTILNKLNARSLSIAATRVAIVSLMFAFAPSSIATAANSEVEVLKMEGYVSNQDLGPLNILIVRADSNVSLRHHIDDNKIALAYINFGSSIRNDMRPQSLASKGLVADGKGGAIIDARNKRWAGHMVHTLLPHLIHMGFKGIYIEGIEDQVKLEKDNPAMSGLIAGVRKTLRTIHLHYPKIYITSDNPDNLPSSIRQEINMPLAEKITSGYKHASLE